MKAQQQKHITNILAFLKKAGKQNFSHDEIHSLFLALLSPSEIETLSQRLDILKLLQEGMPQREISEKLGVGIATVTRGSRALKEHFELFAKLSET